MKLFIILIGLTMGMVSCNDHPGANGENADDSVSTDSLQNPSFNPGAEADSATKQMNLDSSKEGAH